MEDKDFFHQATLRICGTLEIDTALQALLHFLTGFMPVTKIFLQYFDNDYQAMRTIAFASETECGPLDLLTPLSGESGKMAAEGPPTTDAFIVDDPSSFPVSREMTAFHGVPSTSIMLLILKARSDAIGYAVLVSEGPDRFEPPHLEWLRMLKEPLAIAMSNALKHREVCQLNDLLADDNRYLHGELRRLCGDEIVGANFGLKQVMFKVQQVAALDSPVLLLGETGTGKDVIANWIHYSSNRSEGAFVGVNCGAIPDTLIDSELFGHEKGSFTGALAQKRGRFERAHGGTLFLDEIGELPLQAQVRLLRVLQSKEIERVGGVKAIPLDIRIVAATNRDLEKMVAERQFREDLWFRLNVFPIWIPPLRDRRVDIPALIQHFIRLKTSELKLAQVPTLAPGEMDHLMRYHWPGNVRELQNVIERALILNPAGPLRFDHLVSHAPREADAGRTDEGVVEPLETVIGSHIRRALTAAGGKVNGSDGAAALLGINPSTLRYRMKKMGIAYGRKHS